MALELGVDPIDGDEHVPVDEESDDNNDDPEESNRLVDRLKTIKL